MRFEDTMSDRTILVTGAAGFIGFHVARLLLAEGRNVVGLDSLNSYYDPALKQSRLDVLRQDPRFVWFVGLAIVVEFAAAIILIERQNANFPLSNDRAAGSVSL